MNEELFKVMEVLEALYNNNHNHDLTAREVDDMLNRSIGSINKILELSDKYSVSLDSQFSATEELN
jgi:hypothetical protein